MTNESIRTELRRLNLTLLAIEGRVMEIRKRIESVLAKIGVKDEHIN